MRPAFWIQVNMIVQPAQMVLYVQKHTSHDSYNKNTDDLSQQDYAKRKQPTSDALVGPGHVLSRRKKSRLR
jgi:hypothetical protein